MTDLKIRKIDLTSEIGVLEDMLYEAIFQKDESKLCPRSVIFNPEIYVYIDNFGNQKDDHCFMAVVDGKIVGAVWVRILDGKIKGYGNIDSQTPEFAISLYKQYRNLGIGTLLMNTMISHLKSVGYLQTSLSVAKDNYAVRLYEKVGFKTIKEQEDDYLMVCDLTR